MMNHVFSNRLNTDQPNRSSSIRHSFTYKDKGYFNSESMIKKVYREGVVLLSGGRAILLQLAHPFVAAGVDDHSNFQDEILKRLYRTLLFMQNLVFEDRHRAQITIQHFHAMHAQIRGRLPHDAGRFPAGTPYSGRDPEAKLWVHATFVDTSLKVYERFITPLSAQERSNFYNDTLVLARLMEIPEEILPQTFEDFDDYMRSALSGDTLAVTSTAKRLANAVLYPRVGFFPTISAGLLRLVTAGILPDRFRREFGLKWNRSRQFALNWFAFLVRTLRPVVPPLVWQNPFLKGKLTYFLLWGRNTSNNKR